MARDSFDEQLKRLQDELRGDRPRPTKRDIINLIPKEKRVLLIHKKVKR